MTKKRTSADLGKVNPVDIAKAPAPSVGKTHALPALADLHLRHIGVTPAICASFAEAASVCLSRHHVSPRDLRVESPKQTLREVTWKKPDQRTSAAWGNSDDATRDAAYSVCLAAVEAELGWLAIERTDVRTGADYYVGPPGTPLEAAFRLEVSGVDKGDDASIAYRLEQKIEQTKNGKSSLPAVAAVVGFKAALVKIRKANKRA